MRKSVQTLIFKCFLFNRITNISIFRIINFLSQQHFTSNISHASIKLASSQNEAIEVKWAWKRYFLAHDAAINLFIHSLTCINWCLMQIYKIISEKRLLSVCTELICVIFIIPLLRIELFDANPTSFALFNPHFVSLLCSCFSCEWQKFPEQTEYFIFSCEWQKLFSSILFLNEKFVNFEKVLFFY